MDQYICTNKKTFYAVTFLMQLALKKIFRFGNFFVITKDYFKKTQWSRFEVISLY